MDSGADRDAAGNITATGTITATTLNLNFVVNFTNATTAVGTITMNK